VGLQRNLLASSIVIVFAVWGVLVVNAASQRTDPGDPVAREVRDLRLALERAAALSAQVTLAAQQASAAQGRIAAITVELANIRSQSATVAAQAARMDKVVSDFERDFPEAVREPSEGLRLPQYQSYLNAKAGRDGQRQAEDLLRARESELVSLLAREQIQWDGLMEKLGALERSLGGQRH